MAAVGAKKRTYVNGHIKDGKCRIAFGFQLGTVVQVSHHNLQISLKQTGTDTHQGKGRKHGACCQRSASQRDGEEQIAQKHDGDAYGNHFAVSELIGQDTADKGQKVNKHQKRRINRAGSGRRPSEVVLQKQDKYGKHGIISESLAGVG